jgi:hypothetical protein
VIDELRDASGRARAAREAGDHNRAAGFWQRSAETAQAAGLPKTAARLRLEWAEDTRRASEKAVTTLRSKPGIMA